MVAMRRLREENIADGGAGVLGTEMSEDGEEVVAGIETIQGDTDTTIASIVGEIVTLTEKHTAVRDRDPGIGMTAGEINTENEIENFPLVNHLLPSSSCGVLVKDEGWFSTWCPFSI